MRKKLLLLVCTWAMFNIAANAQTTATGKVVDEKGAGIAGATVIEKGTNNGTSTSADGSYSIKVKSGASLVISSVGKAPKTLLAGSNLNVTLNSVAQEIDEVIVTAFNIQKSARTTPFTSQVITAEKLQIIPQTNLNSALAGKVAGVQFRGQSAMKLNDQGFLRVRGGQSLTDVGPLYVVDGTFVNSFDINPNDIAELNVLKGANATALFGERARNGAIVITTLKTGAKGGAGIEFSTGLTFDKVYIMPKYQNLYAGGAEGDLTRFAWKTGMPNEWKALDGKNYHDYTDDASWGPRMVGQEYIPWYAWYGGHADSYKTAKLDPQPNNMRDFWNTGVTRNTNISFTKSGEGFTSRLSYTNNEVLGMLPNSKSVRHNLMGSLALKLNEHFDVGMNMNYTNNTITGVFDDGYANASSGSFNQWFHRDLDMNKLRELKDISSPLGGLASWNLKSNPNGYDPTNPGAFYKGNYWYNFYSYFDNVINSQNRERLFGDIYLKYTLNKNLNFRGTIRTNQLNTNYENIKTTLLEQSAAQTGELASYATGQSKYNEMNYEFITNYKAKFLESLDVSASVGGNILKISSKAVDMSTKNGLSVPGLYAIANSKDPLNYSNSRSASSTRSVFAFGDFEWDKTISVSWAIRNDWYSTLPAGSNSLLSPSIGAAFDFSKYTRDALPWLSFGKVFGSWGKKPTAIGAYQSNFLYSPNPNLWGSNFLMSTPDQLVPPGLVGNTISTTEFGFDFRFLKNRLGVNLSYYIEDNKGEPLPVTVSGISGFTSQLVNAAHIQRQGIELIVTAKPISKKNFSWDINTTFSYLIKNPVVSLIDGTNQILLSGGSFGTRFARAFQSVGKDWGQLIGGGMKRNDAGLPLVNVATKEFVRDEFKEWGSVVPKTTGGLINSLTYKDFTLNISLDYQIGGKFFSLSEQWGHFSGLLENTAALNDNGKNVRDDVSLGGGVRVVGVDAADGKTPVDTYVDAQTYYHQFYFNQVAEPYVHSLTFVKLRELALGYNIPVSKLKIAGIFKEINFSVVARNPWLIYREAKNFDPSEISGVQGEDGQYPGTRSLGFNIKFRF